MRQLAWLHATPKPPPGTKRAKAETEAPRLSRIDDMKRRKIAPRMPPNPAPHITDWLIEIGLTEAMGMGVGPISWLAIDAWASRCALPLQPWESRLLRRLSAAYVAEGRRAEDETCPPPWHAVPTARERENEEAELMKLLG
ncbi:hypothetical protein NF699_06400 [Sphingomonadaceae bacterium OTU29LAMAA1]|nr:hypothetical protein NF699_06400 [Sphingomonadaceae bacterium OTU29LAMAA1]